MRFACSALSALVLLAAAGQVASAAGPAHQPGGGPAAAPAAGPAAQPAPGDRVVYAGKLQDGSGRPIAGIYPLTFAFYKNDKAGRAVWSESQFVAVDNGVYAVALGAKQPLPKGFAADKMFIGVAVTGGKEIVREKFGASAIELASLTTPVPEQPAPTPSKPNMPGAPPSKVSGSYADLAGRALEAQTAEKLGTLTEEDVRKLAKSGEGTSAKVKIGAAKRYTESAGGTGGTKFNLVCPPGHVAVGISGAGALYIDSVSVICSPLE